MDREILRKMQCFDWCTTKSKQPIDTQTEAQIQNYERYVK